MAIQVFGGMGYIEESGVAQHFRDMRIAPIYEGTNGIQAMDLVGRKLPMRMGGVVNDHFARIRATIAELEGTAELKALAAPLQSGLESLETATNWIFENGLADPKEALAGATPYLGMFGFVTGGWFSARLALAALEELAEGSDDTAYMKRPHLLGIVLHRADRAPRPPATCRRSPPAPPVSTRSTPPPSPASDLIGGRCAPVSLLSPCWTTSSPMPSARSATPSRRRCSNDRRSRSASRPTSCSAI